MPSKGKEATRLIFCSGKVYYDLLRYREEKDNTDAAIIRIEQLYPLDEKAIQAVAAESPKAKTIVWCQEESQNMGAWSFIEPRLRRLFNDRPVAYAGRNASASPAVGSLGVHKQEQRQLVEEAFTLG